MLQFDKPRMSTELLCMTIQQGHLHVPIADATQFDHRLKGEFVNLGLRKSLPFYYYLL